MAINIGMIHWYYPPIRGGVETLLKELGEGLVKKGVTVHVLCAGKKSDKKVKGVWLHKRPFMDRMHPKGGKKAFENGVSDFIKKYKIELVNAHNFHIPRIAYQGELLVKVLSQLDVPAVLSVHNSASAKLHKKKLAVAKKVLNHNWIKITAISNFIKKSLTDIGVPSRKIVVIPNGVDIKKFNPKVNGRGMRKRLVGKRKMILCSCRVVSGSGRSLVERKGVDMVIASCGRLNKKYGNFKLVLTGASPKVTERKHVAKEIVSLGKTAGISKNLFLGPSFKDAEMPPLYSAADVLVLAAKNEPFGLVFIEAMATGKPVIGMKSGGAVEVIDNGKNGYLVKNEKEMTKALLKLVSNKKLANGMGRNGRKKVTTKFSLQNMVNNYYKLLRT